MEGLPAEFRALKRGLTARALKLQDQAQEAYALRRPPAAAAVPAVPAATEAAAAAVATPGAAAAASDLGLGLGDPQAAGSGASGAAAKSLASSASSTLDSGAWDALADCAATELTLQDLTLAQGAPSKAPGAGGALHGTAGTAAAIMKLASFVRHNPI